MTPSTDTRKAISEYMYELVQRVQRERGYRLTAKEVQDINIDALQYAKILRKWIPQKEPKPKKGKPK